MVTISTAQPNSAGTKTAVETRRYAGKGDALDAFFRQ
jgi:hypothetical protein